MNGKHLFLSSSAFILSLLSLLVTIVYASGDTSIGFSTSVSIIVDRAGIYYLKNYVLPFIFPAFLIMMNLSLKESEKEYLIETKKTPFSKRLAQGWMLFGFFAFLTTTVGILGFFEDLFAVIYLGAYFIAVALSFVTLVYFVLKKVRVNKVKNVDSDV